MSATVPPGRTHTAHHHYQHVMPPLSGRSPRPSFARRTALALALLALSCTVVAGAAPLAGPRAGTQSPRKIVVRYAPPQAADPALASAASLGATASTPRTQIVSPAPKESLAHALARPRARRDVEWAVPDYVAHVSAVSAPALPDDVGDTSEPGGWQQLQWN